MSAEGSSRGEKTPRLAIFMINQDELRAAFLRILELSHVQISASDLRFERLPAPHRRPSRLPQGLQAVYAFFLGESCLKVGKAGPKSEARFTSQHYGMNAPSTLAKSILANRDRMAELAPPELRLQLNSLTETSVGPWVEFNTCRMHLFLPTSAGAFPVSLAEAFFQCRFQPIFEGKVA
ncbi:MAG: hypothetical protein ACREHV_14735 [Rhizomicrobium sp.]